MNGIFVHVAQMKAFCAIDDHQYNQKMTDILRKIIHTQENSVLMLELPRNLQGRRIEVIAFAIEEDVPSHDSPTASMADFFGTISTEDAESLHHYTKQARNEWDRDF